MPALKIASFEIVDLPLIGVAAATGLPLIVSTGMAVLGEIEDALGAARRGGATAVGLMQCTSVYPAPAERANLRAMETMRAAFGVPVGLSDHTAGTAVPIAAAALGAALRREALHARPHDGGPRPPVRARAGRAAHDGRRASATRRPRSATGARTGRARRSAQEMYTLARRSLIAHSRPARRARCSSAT